MSQAAYYNKVSTAYIQCTCVTSVRYKIVISTYMEYVINFVLRVYVSLIKLFQTNTEGLSHAFILF